MSRAKGQSGSPVGRRMGQVLRLLTAGTTASGAAYSTWIVNADTPGAAIVLATIAGLNVSKMVLDLTAPRRGEAQPSEDSSADR